VSAETACWCCGPNEELLDALAELFLDPELSDDSVDILNQNAWEVYG
jgi:hypothetical protein